MRILIVDDNADDRKILRCNLEHHGCQVLEAIDGQDALEKAGLHMPDMIISDALMPRMDGFQFLRALKKDKALQAIPFVFYSATYTGYEETDLAISIGARAYIIKPKDPVEFWQELSCIIDSCERGGTATTSVDLVKEDHEYLKKYSNIVASKLETKVQELEQALAERKQAEEALREREAFIRNILDSVDEGFIVVDRQYRILSVNKAFCNFTKMREEQVVGQPCYEVSHQSNRPCFEAGVDCAVKRTFETGIPSLTSHLHVDKNGAKQNVEIKSYPITDASGYVTSAIETINDVTEKNKLEEQFIQSQKMESIGRLAGGVAHDFNNILSAIIGYSEILYRKAAGDPKVQEQLSIIMDSGKKAAMLTQQLLALSRKQVLNMGTYNLNDIVDGMAGMITRIIGEDVVIGINTRQQVAGILADKSQIEQILLNLAVNARDAMPSGGSLTISTENAFLDENYARNHADVSPGPHVMLAVSDTGSGMSKEVQDRIFEPFFTTKEIGKGTGLGLATVYGIVKQHNGNIIVYSEPGHGTTFKVYFPAVRKTAGDAAVKLSDALPRGTESVLVVDDDATVVRLIFDILEPLGYRVATASNGEEALKLCGARPGAVDLLLTDVIMPGMNGKVLADTITAAFPAVKVIFMSGYPHDVIAHHGILDSGVVLIQKPVTGAMLAGTVRETLDGQGIRKNIVAP